MAKDDYFVIVYVVLKYLYDCLKGDKDVDFEAIKSDALCISYNYWCYIMEHMQEYDLIEGLSIKKTKNGILITGWNRICITPTGISYLFENSLIQKAKKTLMDIKDIVPFA